MGATNYFAMSPKGYSASFFLLCVIALLTMFSNSLVNPLLSIFAKRLGAQGVYIGLAISAYWVSRIVMEIPSGFASSRFGFNRPMAAGLVLTALGCGLCSFVADPLQLILARALMGLGAPLFFAVAMTYVVNLFDAQRRGRAMGLFQGIEFFGTVVGSTFSGYIISLLEFRGSFLLSAGMVIAGLALLLGPPHIRRDASTNPESSGLSLSSLGEVFFNRNLLTVSSATFAEFVMSTGVIYTVFPLYADEQLGFSLTGIGLIMGARSVGFVLSLLTMGSVSDRIGRRPVLLFGLASTAILMSALSFATSFLSIAGVVLLIGVTTGAIWIVCPILAAEAVSPSNRGAAIGTYRTFFDLGSILGPIIMTGVLGLYGVTACFYLAAGLLLVNLVPSFGIRESRRELG